MQQSSKDDLKLIGDSLNCGNSPRIGLGGVLVPTHADTSTTRKEKQNEPGPRQEGAYRPSETPRASGASQESGKSGEDDQAASLVGHRFADWLDQETVLLKRAYPETTVITAPEGAVITVHSSLLRGNREAALFVTFLSASVDQAKSWAFWKDPLFPAHWIGPRHTNYFDGSICAYETTDRTWHVGLPLTELFDYYSLWAVRHLHLRYFGRWPGPQRVHQPSERLAELHPDEFCGCNKGTERYSDCCMPRDLKVQTVRGAISRLLNIRRAPPVSVVRFARGMSDAPPVQVMFFG